MFFTTIEDEARLSGLRVQNIFTGVARNIKAVFDRKSLISFSNSFSSQFQTDVVAIENYIGAINSGMSAEEAFNATMRGASIEAQNFANSLNAVTRSEEEVAGALANFANQQAMSQVSMMAQNNSLSNVRLLLNEYNSGLQTCGLTQQQFIDSVGQSNSSLGRYLSNVSTGKATMVGYVGSLIAGKIATVGLKVATMALNAVIGMGIGLIISLVSSGIMQLIEYAKENLKPLADKIEDVNSKLKETQSAIKEISDNFQKLKQNADEVIPRFVELAKGVNSFGENITLTDDEYNEFLKLNNKIAEMFPELNMGMDDNGNAMLALSYNADTLTDSLNALVEAQREQANQDLASKLPDLVSDTKTKRNLLAQEIDGYKNEITNYQNWIKNFSSGSYTTDWQWSEWDGVTKSAEQRILESAGVKFHREVANTRHVGGGGINNNAAHDEVQYKYVIDDDMAAFERAMNDYISGINNQINNAEKQIENTWQSMSPSLQAWLKTNSTFDAFSESLQQIASTMLKNVDWEKLGLETDEEITGYIQSHILEPLSQADFKTQAAFDKLLAISPDSFNSVSDYTNAIKNSIQEIADMSDTDGLDYDSIFEGLGYDEILKKYEEAVNGIQKLLPSVSKEMIESLSPSDVVESFNYIKNYGITTWGDLQTFISKKRLIDSFNIEDIEKLKDALDDLKNTYNGVKDIIDDYNDNGYYTIDNLKSLLELEPEYLNTLINEKGQIDLNSQAYKDYVAAKAKTLVIDQIKSLYNTIIEMSLEEAQAYANAEAYDAEADSLEDLISATTSYYLVLAKAKDTENNTTAYTDALKQSFGTVANYAAVYDSWLNSLSTSTNEFSTATDEATSALEAQKESLEAEKDALEDEKDALNDAKDALEDYKDSLSDAKDNLQNLIDLTTDYIKQLKEDEKDALQEQKDSFDEIIAKRKKALELAKEEREEADKLADKQNAVAKDKLALAIAQLDDSSAGKKTQKQAAENLASSQKDLSDYLYEKAYNARIAALEAEQEAFDESMDKQIAKIDEYLDNARQLYEDACYMIDNDTGELYGKLWAYTYKYTTQTRAEFDYMWNNAQLALQRYRGENDTLIGVMEHLQQKIYDTDVQIANLDTQISNCETQIGYLDKAISNTSDAISNTSSSIDSVSSSLNGLGNSISDYIDKLNQLANVKVSGTDNSDITPTYIGRGYDAPSGNYYYKVKFRGRDYYGYVGDSSDTTSVRERAYNAIMKEVYKYNSFNDVNPLLFRNAIVNHHAKGTKSSPGGLSIVDEEGLFSEFIPYQIGKGRYSFLPEGNPVFSKAMTNTLFDFAKDPREFVNSNSPNSNESISGDITVANYIYGDVDEQMLKRLEKKEKDIVSKAKDEVIETVLKGRKWR